MPTTEHSEVETRRRRSLLQPTIEEVVQLLQPYHKGRMENDDACFGLWFLNPQSIHMLIMDSIQNRRFRRVQYQ
jgi:hypothetical protein